MNLYQARRIALVFFAWAIGLTFVDVPSEVLADESSWRAGVATVKITPEKPMWMAGYASRDHVADGKLTDLWAKALVLEDARGIVQF